MDDDQYIKASRTRAARARANAAALRTAAEQPGNVDMKASLLRQADDYEARAKAADKRVDLRLKGALRATGNAPKAR